MGPVSNGGCPADAWLVKGGEGKIGRGKDKKRTGARTSSCKQQKKCDRDHKEVNVQVSGLAAGQWRVMLRVMLTLTFIIPTNPTELTNYLTLA